MNIDRFFTGLKISAFGLSAQRKKLNAIASNIANAETVRTENGEPYRRKVVVMEEAKAQNFSRVLSSTDSGLATTNKAHFKGATNVGETEAVPGSVQAKEVEDASDFRIVYDPTNPEADENGYVRLPNVNIVSEMVEMMSATRAYEANVTAANAAKTMTKDALEI
ncbi:MAG TPA: flagellar basal body rod protein FlgC [Bacteroidota bacterium]|nr:flagellar basal body rod protein FlgC [Bacteroidota bacterium]